MSEFPEVYFVDVKQNKATRFPRKRPQQWYFVVLAAGNHEPVMTSSMYTNYGDCRAQAVKANGQAVTVMLREKEKGNVTLRRAVPSGE